MRVRAYGGWLPLGERRVEAEKNIYIPIKKTTDTADANKKKKWPRRLRRTTMLWLKIRNPAAF